MKLTDQCAGHRKKRKGKHKLTLMRLVPHFPVLHFQPTRANKAQTPLHGHRRCQKLKSMIVVDMFICANLCVPELFCVLYWAGFSFSRLVSLVLRSLEMFWAWRHYRGFCGHIWPPKFVWMVRSAFGRVQVVVYGVGLFIANFLNSVSVDFLNRWLLVNIWTTVRCLPQSSSGRRTRKV